MAARRKPDSCDFMADGQVRLVFNSESRTLRRPTIGEMKEFNAELVRLAAEQSGKDATSVTETDLNEIMSSTLAWWANVIDALRGEDELPAPADHDDFPTWLMNADLLAKLQNHWREVPWASGGN